MVKYKIALLPSHPKQVWMLYAFEKHFQKQNPRIEFRWIIRDKDISCDLADSLGIKYHKISSASSGLFSNAIELFINIFRAYSITKSQKIDLWITKYGAGNIAAFLSKKTSLSFNDDDVDVVPLIALTSYTFAEKVLVPFCTRMGKYEHKAVRYQSLQEVLYLHSNRFKENENIWKQLGIKKNQKFAIIRMVSLKAHHDVNAQGISEQLLKEIITTLEKKNIQPFITSEKKLPPNLDRFSLDIPTKLIHTALKTSIVFIGDSLSMSTEAALLGTHSIRISTFSGRISTLNWLEKNNFVYGFQPNQMTKVIRKLEHLLQEKICHKHLQHFSETRNDPINQWTKTVTTIIEKNNSQASSNKN